MNAPKNFHSEEILQKFEDQKSKHLIYSLVLDFLGMSSLFLPLLGEGLDLIYAPIYGVAIYSLYQMRLGKVRSIVGGVFGTVEEFLPFTDFIPTATIMWAYTYKVMRQATLRTFTRNYKGDRDIIDQELNHQSVSRRRPLGRLMDWVSNVFSNSSKQKRYDDIQIDDGGDRLQDILELKDRIKELPASEPKGQRHSDFV